MTRPRFTLRRAIAVPIAFAAVFGVLDAFKVPREAAAFYAPVAGLALGGIILLSRTSRELIAAFAAVGLGVASGHSLCLPCAESLSLLGAPFGLVVFKMLHRIFPGTPPTSKPGAPDDPIHRII